MIFKVKTHKTKTVEVKQGRRIETEIEIPSYTFMIVDRTKASQQPLPNAKQIDGSVYDIDGQEYKLEPVDDEAKAHMEKFHAKRAAAKAKGAPPKAEAAVGKK